MNDNAPMAVGDTVRRRGHPRMIGMVWAIERGKVIVLWGDPDENAYCDPRRLEKISLPLPPAASPARPRPAATNSRAPSR